MDGKTRCGWCAGDALYTKYHDKEWGREIKSDKKLFKFLILESAQAGLSWITILRRRENYAKAFAGFDVKKVAVMTQKDVENLMNDAGIIRNRRKIESAISNAQAFIKVQQEFGSFRKYLQGFLPKGKSIDNKPETICQIPPRTELSDNISKDMKKRGFSFFGTTICYAFLQATGYINDHIKDCWVRSAAKQKK